MLGLDILVNCQKGYYNDNSVLVMEPRLIRRNYFATWFSLDLVVMVPMQAFVWSSGATHTYMAWLRLPKLLRIYRSFESGREG